jgi:hypothetical protein
MDPHHAQPFLGQMEEERPSQVFAEIWAAELEKDIPVERNLDLQGSENRLYPLQL